MTRSIPRLPLLAAMLLVTLLVVPVAARADDQTFARTALTEAGTLKRAEGAAQRALRRVDSRGTAAIPAARRAVRGVITTAARMAEVVAGQEPSTADGADAKKQLLKLLRVERSAYGTLDDALAAFEDGDTEQANRLLGRAQRQIKGVGRQAGALGARLAKLAG